VALTLRRLGRATLARQHLLERTDAPVTEVVRRVLALQAQEPASPYLALWNRIDGFDPADLDTAFADGSVLKATLMRITLHAVAAEDHRMLRAAVRSTLRASRLGDRRFRATGLTPEEADRLAALVAEHADRPRTRDEFETLLAEHLGGPPDPGVWWALRTIAPLVHAPTGGPWSFGLRPAFLAAPGGRGPAAGGSVAPDHEGTTVMDGVGDDVRPLVRRYLAAFGPASAQDLGRFAMLRRATLRPALAAMADELVTVEGPDGEPLLDVPGAPLPDEDVDAPPRLLPMWDSVLLAHADRRRVVPPEHRAAVIRRNGDVLPTLLVDGQVRGVWRPVGDAIEASAFRPLPDEAWDGLAQEARGLLGLLADRDPAVYRRYANWWADLPAVDVRRLPA
jgi:hypothetical protein